MHAMPLRSLALLTVLSAAAFASPADARERTRQTTNGQGQTVTRQWQGTRTENGRTTSSTTTGPNGQTVTGSGTVTHQDGTTTRASTLTGPDGQSADCASTSTKTEDGRTTTGGCETANGTSSYTRNRIGGSVSTSVTGRRGRSLNRTSQTTAGTDAVEP